MKGKMKKWLVFVLAGVLCLSGCSSGGSSSTTTGAEADASSETGTATESEASSDSGEEAASNTVELADTLTYDYNMGESLGTTSKDTLVIAVSADPQNFKSVTQSYLSFWSCLREEMMTVDYEGFQNQLVEDYVLDDDYLGVTVTLKEGICFSDGTEMTSEDCVYSMQYWYENDLSSQLAHVDLEGMEVIDDYNFYVPFAYVCGSWQNALYVPVFSKNAYETMGEAEFWKAPVTTGAYYVSEYNTGDSFTLTRNENYWRGIPIIETIQCRIITETSVQLMELQTGGVDLVYDLTTDDLVSVDLESGTYTDGTSAGTVTTYIGMNATNDALKDLKVRQALAYATDRDSLLAGAYGGSAYYMWGIMGSTAIGYLDAYEEENYPYNYDPEKAMELLAEAGYGDGLELRILTDGTAVRVAMAEQLQNMYAEVGITLTIDEADFATASDILMNQPSEYDLYIRGAGLAQGDCISYIDNETGISGLCHFEEADAYERYVEVLDKLNAAVETDERIAAYQELQTACMEEFMFWIPLFTPQVHTVYTSDLKGIGVHDGRLQLFTAYFE
ncbi:MAG: ABC transporter substrate-binding protein [Lachnospiraceae bacterium]|nr:ABC transporter substrate-binding protein [Lachnospiraceae bacterium]